MTAGLLGADEACAAIHAALATLPAFRSPAEVPFHDGLYFFYEHGETSRHAPEGRVVRVGNHPRSDGTLRRRLTQHLRGHKNGSVFRKAVGGALIRRDEPSSPCLLPGPGRGHWEAQGQEPCAACAPVEERVTRLVAERFTFRCVPVVDRGLRNHLEARLIATLAACTVCTPGSGWLGLHAYPANMRRSGLWNVEFVGGPLMSDEDLRLFRQAAGASHGTALPLPGVATAPAGAPLGPETLLILPCSKRKSTGGRAGATGTGVADLVPDREAAEIRSARSRIRVRAKVDESGLLPAVDRYSGHLHVAAGDAITQAMERGVYVAIVSGGYGVVLGSEPIGDYEAHLDPRDWPDSILERCLVALARRAGVRRVVSVATSAVYAQVTRHAPWDEGLDVILLQPDTGHGIAERLRATGHAVRDVLAGADPTTWVDTATGIRLRVEHIRRPAPSAPIPPHQPLAAQRPVPSPPAPISPVALLEIREALGRYRSEVNAARLAETTRRTYLTHAENFVRWLEGEFHPGSGR